MNQPLAAPALLESARRLAAALQALHGRGQAAALLTRLAVDLGPGCYPLLLKLFCIVGESRDLAARRQLAVALGDLLRAGALPAGPLNGWGEADAPAFARSLFGAASRRKLDPLTYLCAWYSQTTDRPVLDAGSFRSSLIPLLQVIGADPFTARLYRDKLLNDATTLPEGSISQTTRERLRQLAHAWASGQTPQQIAALLSV